MWLGSPWAAFLGQHLGTSVLMLGTRLQSEGAFTYTPLVLQRILLIREPS